MVDFLNNPDVKVVPFRWYHPRMMELRKTDLAYYSDLDDFEDRLRGVEREKHSYTATYRNQMACCFGTRLLWPGAAESWFIGSKLIDTAPITLTRSCRRYMDYIAREQRLKRMQITCDTQDELAVRWAIALKFQREGLLRRYGPSGSDHIMFARIYDEQSFQS